MGTSLNVMWMFSALCGTFGSGGADGPVGSERHSDGAVILDLEDRVPERAPQIEMRAPAFGRGRQRRDPVQVEVQRHVRQIGAVVPRHVAGEFELQSLAPRGAKDRRAAERRLQPFRDGDLEVDPHLVITAPARGMKPSQALPAAERVKVSTEVEIPGRDEVGEQAAADRESGTKQQEAEAAHAPSRPGRRIASPVSHATYCCRGGGGVSRHAQARFCSDSPPSGVKVSLVTPRLDPP